MNIRADHRVQAISLKRKRFGGNLIVSILLPAMLTVMWGCVGATGNTTSTTPPPTNPSTYAISGTISPTAAATGSTITLGGASSATTTPNGSGAFSFAGLVDGAYTVTPSNSSYTFAPTSLNVTLNGANMTSENFTGSSKTTPTYAISGTISPTAAATGSTITLGGASSATTTPNGSGAFSFAGLANGSYTVTPSNSSYAFAPTSLNVTVNGANASGENFAGTSKTTPTFSISGTVSPRTATPSTMTLSGVAAASTTTDGSGNYTFSNLAAGAYTVTPGLAGYTFTPTSENATVSNTNITSVNFTSAAQTFSISGAITPTAAAIGATVTLGGTSSATATPNGSGAFTFNGVTNGPYTVTPSNGSYAFTPASANVTVSGANSTGVNFTGSVSGTHSISGTITPAANGSGATVTLGGAGSATVTADSSGNFTFGSLGNGSYTITVTHPMTQSVTYTFSPASQNVTVNGANATSTNVAATIYFGTEPSHSTYLPRSDAYCTSAVNASTWEPRPDNNTANHNVVSPSTFNWSSTESYWTKWIAKRAQVTGNYTGTTSQIIQWAACKWGIDEDSIRADAVVESYWHQNTIGDVCGPAGEGSYGLNQIKNQDCTGTAVHGGYPNTMNSTPLAVDWFGAHTRSCYDGDFYDGGQWLYNGQTVDQIAAANGWPYVFWACVGFNYSGNWNPGQAYQVTVQGDLANKVWLTPNF
jgi:hypothetical protein